MSFTLHTPRFAYLRISRVTPFCLFTSFTTTTSFTVCLMSNSVFGLRSLVDHPDHIVLPRHTKYALFLLLLPSATSLTNIRPSCFFLPVRFLRYTNPHRGLELLHVLANSSAWNPLFLVGSTFPYSNIPRSACTIEMFYCLRVVGYTMIIGLRIHLVSVHLGLRYDS